MLNLQIYLTQCQIQFTICDFFHKHFYKHCIFLFHTDKSSHTKKSQKFLSLSSQDMFLYSYIFYIFYLFWIINGCTIETLFLHTNKIIFKHCIKLDYISFCLAIIVLPHVKVILKFFDLLIFYTIQWTAHLLKNWVGTYMERQNI